MKLSEKLRELRKAANRTQQQVADEMGIHINTLKKYLPDNIKNAKIYIYIPTFVLTENI